MHSGSLVISPLPLSTIDPSVFRCPSTISVKHHGVDLVLELDVILGQSDPSVQIRQHPVVCGPPITIPVIVFLIRAGLNLSRLHEHERYCFLDQVFLDGLCYQISPEFLPEYLLGDGIGNGRIEVFTVNDYLVPGIIGIGFS